MQAVVALRLGRNPVGQFLDCNGTQNNVTHLVLVKDNVETRFNVESKVTGIRLDLSAVQLLDERAYIVCVCVFSKEPCVITVSTCWMASLNFVLLIERVLFTVRILSLGSSLLLSPPDSPPPSHLQTKKNEENITS